MNKEEQFKTTIKAYTLTGIVWALVGTFAGLLNQLQIFTQWPSSDTIMTFGYLRPIYTIMLIFGAGLSLFMGVGYYILKNQEGSELKHEWLSLLGFGLHQLAIAIGIMVIASGANKGREFGELPWISDNLIALSLVIFLIVAKLGFKNVSSPSKASMFALLGAAGGLIAYFLGSFGLPYTLVSSQPLFGGVQDNAVAEFLRAGVYGFFILVPVFAALYYFVPLHQKNALYSGSTADFQAMAMMILIPLSGSAALAYTLTPGISQTIGLVASLALAVAVLMGAINVRQTVTGSSVSDTLTGFFRIGCILTLTFAVLRAVSYLPVMQKVFGYTWWNAGDISVDMATYGLIIFSGAAYIMMHKISGNEINNSMAGIHLMLLLAGAVLILVGNIGGGLMESSAMSAMNEEGALAVTEWTAVTGVGSMMSIHGLSLVGYLAIFLGMSVGTYNIMTVQAEAE
jgi:cbb3-type cytochrome oxidase subunit 1